MGFKTKDIPKHLLNPTLKPARRRAPRPPRARAVVSLTGYNDVNNRDRDTRIDLTLPVVVVSEANRRDIGGHIRRKKQQKEDVGKVLACFKPILFRNGTIPKKITFVRLASRKLDKGNLGNAFKAVEDATAKFFGVDDGPDGPVEWNYDQLVGPVDGIRIEMVWDLRNGV